MSSKDVLKSFVEKEQTTNFQESYYATYGRILKANLSWNPT